MAYPGSSRRRWRRRRLALTFAALAAGAALADELPNLGRALFFDTGLSATGTQACVTCHNPAAAFTDNRDNGVSGAASLGTDGRSLGDRNAPTLTYVSFVPEFHRDAHGEYTGGLFHDGRAETLEIQAAEPFTNPLEMAMPHPREVGTRILQTPAYRDAIASNFGDGAAADPDQAFDAATRSIAAFEHSAEFSTFDSKYDRYLRGEYEMTEMEELGRLLFFSNLVNCSRCHLRNNGADPSEETFTNYRYNNIGIPANDALRARNGLSAAHRDPGLAATTGDPAHHGKFRVPTLRNVAVTAPYMHNGVFAELETAIVFYSKFTVENAFSRTNPETGRAWRDPEAPETIDHALLAEGQPIDATRAEALEAFLRTLTDRRYEPLLER